MGEFKLNELDIDLGATKHKWFFGAFTKLVELARPAVSMLLQHEMRVHVDSAMEIVHTQSGCALLKDGLQLLDPLTLHFETKDPITKHVPLVGDVDTTVKSAIIDLPKSMTCLR